MMPRTLILAACMAVASCSDPTGPCNRPFACEVRGVDLAVIDSRVVEGKQIDADPVTGSAVYAAGSITVEFTVINRGDTASAEERVSLVGIDAHNELLPALEPGETAKIRMTHDYTYHFSVIPTWSSASDPHAADHTNMSIFILPTDTDADAENNTLMHWFHVAVPVFRGTLSDVAEMRQNEPLPVSTYFENVSLRNVSAQRYHGFLCIWDIDIGCDSQGWTYFERFPLNDLAAGEAFDTSFAAALPAAAMAVPEASFTGTLLLCIMPSDDPEFVWPGPSGCVDAEDDVVFRPDYESCNPPVVVMGVPLTMSAANCGPGRADNYWQFHVAAFDAISGQQYAMEGNFLLHDADGDYLYVQPSGFTVPTSGRWYLIHPSIGPTTLLVQMLD